MNNNFADDVPVIISSVTKKIVNTINVHGLAENGSSILVAVSGGADSVCLLHVLNQIKTSNNFKIYAAHLNHQIRGDEANRDEEYVKKLCSEFGVECFTEHADIPKMALEHGMTEEEAGRAARYNFFKRICKENDIDYIATAHNKNDQAETVLMRVIRGSGLSGLRGIKYKREDGVIRPLLDVTRADIEKYCAEAGLEYKTDSTNNDDNYTRNRIRHKLIPMIEKDFNPSIIDSLSNLANNLDDDGEFIDGYVSRLYERLRSPMPGGNFKALHINSMKLIKSRAVLSRLIISCARDEMGQDYSLEKKHINSVLALMSDNGGAAVNLPGGLRVVKRYGWLEFCSEVENAQKDLNSSNNGDFCIEVTPNKLYNIKNAGVNISYILVNSNALKLYDGDIALDADKLGVTETFSTSRFYVRNRRPGDKFAVYKNGKSKKLKNLFIDLKIRSEKRDSVPLFCNENGEILAILGIRANEKYKMTRFTKNILVIHYEKYED